MSDLEREIHRLLDAGESPSEKLADALEAEPELRRTALEMEQLEAVLGEWAASPLDLDEDVFVRRIAQRLDEQLSPLEHDPTLPPAFDDDDSWRHADEHSGEFALDALTDQVSEPQVVAAAAPGFAQPPAMEAQPAGKVVRMQPKGSQRWVFAAAAVVGLVAVGGLFVVSGTQDEPTMAMVQEPATESAAVQGAPHDYAPAPSAVGSAEATPEPELDRALAAADDEGEERVLARGSARAPVEEAQTEAEYYDPAPVAAMASTTAAAEAPGMRMRRARLEDRSDPAKATIVRTTRARVASCFDEPPDGVRVRVWIDGPTGRVREVDVPSGGRPAEVECVRRTVRAVRFPLRDGVARYTTTLEY